MTTDNKTTKFDDRGPRLNDQQLDAHCLNWVRWCDTRKFYLRPTPQGLLARMQPSKTKEEPHIRNDPDMAFFNAAVHSLADMEDHAEGFACFRAKYMLADELIKVQVDKLKISRPTYYSRARSFARKALSLSSSLKRVHTESLRVLGETMSID
jgi:hypothetical protein